MTTVTRRYALYQAQQGAYITDVEQLQASISLPSTIKMVFSLRKFTKFSVGLVVLWSFYYLGSQASKREYAYAVSNATMIMSGAYPLANMTDYFDYFTSNSSTYRDKLSRDFLSALWDNDDKLPTYGIDNEGRVLLPDPAYLYALNPNGTVNTTSAHEFPIRPSDTTYLTFGGRPLYILQDNSYTYDNGTTVPWSYWLDERIVGDYSIRTSYFKFDCLSLEAFPVENFPAHVQETRVVSLNISESNLTQNTAGTSQQLEFWQRWFVNSTIYDPYNETASAVPGPSINGSDGGAIKITCDIVEPQMYLDIHCTATACLATRMSCPDIPPSVLKTTIFSNVTFASTFFDNMLLAEGKPRTRDRDDWGDVTNYLKLWDGDILAVGRNTLNSSDKKQVLDSLATSLDTIVNTYLNLATALVTPTDEDRIPSGYEVIAVDGAPFDPHYALFWEWIVIDYLSGLLLLAAAIASFWLRKHTLVPDIFGFVSSLTRDNPHFPALPGSATMDGISRTRALRNVKVKVGDVGGPHGEIGRIGFVPVHPTIPIGALSKHRKYF